MNDFDYLDLDIHLTPEQQALKTQVRTFAREVLRPAATALDRLADPAQVIAADSAFWPAQRAAYANGFHSAMLPPALGGLGSVCTSPWKNWAGAARISPSTWRSPASPSSGWPRAATPA